MNPRSQRVLVDAHVHFHSCFEIGQFFEGAAGNIAAGARQLGAEPATPGCLLFTESAQDRFFSAFREQPERWSPPGWMLERTAEQNSLLARHESGRVLVLIAGRQIVAREGVEAQALGTTRDFSDGRPIEEIIAEVRDSGALAVLPWGFGKWWFKRGDCARSVLANRDGKELFLGDNAGRLARSPEPRLFGAARSGGIGILPGTDPLPFPRAMRVAGSYGFALEGALDETHPAEMLLGGVRAQSPNFVVFGRLASPLSFCRDQLAMQLRKRRA